MSNMIGMDVDAIENVGRQVQQQAEAVQQVMTAIDGLVSTAEANWRGTDSDQFRDKWNSSYKTVLSNLHQELNDFGTSAITNASAQRQTSAS